MFIPRIIYMHLPNHHDQWIDDKSLRIIGFSKVSSTNKFQAHEWIFKTAHVHLLNVPLIHARGLMSIKFAKYWESFVDHLLRKFTYSLRIRKKKSWRNNSNNECSGNIFCLKFLVNEKIFVKTNRKIKLSLKINIFLLSNFKLWWNIYNRPLKIYSFMIIIEAKKIAIEQNCQIKFSHKHRDLIIPYARLASINMRWKYFCKNLNLGCDENFSFDLIDSRICSRDKFRMELN